MIGSYGDFFRAYKVESQQKHNDANAGACGQIHSTYARFRHTVKRHQHGALQRKYGEKGVCKGNVAENRLFFHQLFSCTNQIYCRKCNLCERIYSDCQHGNEGEVGASVLGMGKNDDSCQGDGENQQHHTGKYSDESPGAFCG